MSFLINPYIFSSSDNYHVVRIDGDSILRGTSEAGQTPVVTLPGTCYEFDGSSLVELTTQDLSDPAALGYTSPWKQYAFDYNAASGKVVVFINCAKGGAEFYPNGDTNNWYSTGANRALAAAKTNACLTLLGRSYLDRIFTGTAVNDVRGAQTLSNIEAALQSYVDWVNSNWIVSNINFVQCGRTESNFNNTARLAAVRNYIKQLARNNASVSIVGFLPAFESAGLTQAADKLHLSNAGNIELGKMCARWESNSSYSKWARSLISSFFTDISSSRKNLIQSYLSGEIANGNYWKHDQLNYFKSDDIRNLYVDWAWLFAPVGVGSPTFVANSHIGTNGTNSQYWKTGYTPSVNAISAVLDNAIYGLKLRTRVTASGVLSIAMGSADGTQRVAIGQNTTPAVIYFVHDNTIHSSTVPDVALAASSLYQVERTAAAVNALYKNVTVIDNIGGLSVGLPGFEIIIGALNTSNTIGSAFSGTYEYCHASAATLDKASFFAASELLMSSW